MAGAGGQGFVQNSNLNGLVGGLGNAGAGGLASGLNGNNAPTPTYAVPQATQMPTAPVTTHADNQGVNTYTTHYRADAPNIQQAAQQPAYQPYGLQTLFNNLMGNYMYNPMAGFTPSIAQNRGIGYTRAPTQTPNLGRAARGTPAPFIDQGIFDEMIADYQARKAEREASINSGGGGG